MKKSTVLGILAVGSTLGYFFLRKLEGDDSELEGIDVKINPKKLVDGALAMSSMNPIAKESVRQLADRALSRYYEHEDD